MLESRVDRLMRVMAIVASGVLLCAGGLALWLSTRDRGPDPLLPDPTMPVLEFPEFQMTDQSERPFSRKDLEGHVTIVGFMFSHCPLMCPSMMHQLSKIYVALEGEPVRFVTISLDPKNDTPARLKEWGKDYRADGERWKLITGEVGLSQKILRQNLKMFVEEDPAVSIPLPDGQNMANIKHSGHVFLVGPDARVLGLFNTQSAEDMDALREHARRAGRAWAQKN